MPSVTIDTGAVASPPLEASVDDIHEYIQTILDWKRLLDENWVAIRMSERAAEILVQDGLYPLRNSLRQLFASKGIVEYDVNTVARVTDHLLQLTPTFEEFFGVRDVLTSELTTRPDILSLSVSANLASDLGRCIVIIALLGSHCRNPVIDHNFVIRYVTDAQTVEVKALIHDLEQVRDDIELVPMDPDYFTGAVLVCSSFRGFVLNIDETAVWNGAQDEIGLELAVRIALYKSRLERGLEPEWSCAGCFTLGLHFYESAKACCQNNPSSFSQRVIRAMVETIEELRMEDTHALRESRGGNALQRMRGEDKAWRRDVDREYHLHYWACEVGTVEFACVVTHDNFHIPE